MLHVNFARDPTMNRPIIEFIAYIYILLYKVSQK